MKQLDWRVVCLSAGGFLSITYVLCVAFDLLFPRYAMYGVWMKLLPGFEWLSWRSFLLGLIETALYGVYFGLVFVPMYNFVSRFFNRPA